MSAFDPNDVLCEHRATNIPCAACTIAHLTAALSTEQGRAESYRGLYESTERDNARLLAKKSGWKKRADRLAAERDAADLNAGRMQRELHSLRQTLASELAAFIDEKMVGAEPGPGEAHVLWYDRMRAVARVKAWLASWEGMAREE